MISISVKRAMDNVKQYLDKEYRHIDFEYSIKSAEHAQVTSDITYEGVESSISIVIDIYDHGATYFSAVLDEIDKTPQVLELIQKLNDDWTAFKFYVREDEFLQIQQMLVCDNEKQHRLFLEDFMDRLLNCLDDETLQELASYTRD